MRRNSSLATLALCAIVIVLMATIFTIHDRQVDETRYVYADEVETASNLETGEVVTLSTVAEPTKVEPAVMAEPTIAPTPEPTPEVDRFAGKSDVEKIQIVLEELGYYTSGVDGDYGPNTREAVLAFQEDHGLLPDGKAGPRTAEALGITFSDPEAVYQYIAPDEGTPEPAVAGATSSTDWYIQINKNTFTTNVYKRIDGEWVLQRSMLSVIGAPGTPTPEGTFYVYAKSDGFWKNGYYWQYFTIFFGEYGTHSLPTLDGECQDYRLGQALSHGCVRQSIRNAKYIWDNVPIGTTVYIYS